MSYIGLVLNLKGYLLLELSWNWRKMGARFIIICSSLWLMRCSFKGSTNKRVSKQLICTGFVLFSNYPSDSMYLIALMACGNIAASTVVCLVCELYKPNTYCACKTRCHEYGMTRIQNLKYTPLDSLAYFNDYGTTILLVAATIMVVKMYQI